MKVSKYILKFFARAISKLPFWLLYLKANFVYLFLYYISRYRRKTVFINLKRSFPEKSKTQLQRIAKQYYRHLANLIFEVIKLKGMSEKGLQKRITIKNPEIIHHLYKNKQSFLVAIGHCGNWEWLGPYLASQFQHRVFGAAKPLNNSFFDQYMNELRSKFGFTPVHFKKTFRALIQHKNHCTATMMAADQTPALSEINYWAFFLNQQTAFFTGLEKMAKALNIAVVFFEMVPVKRGYYEVELKLISENPKATAENEIINAYIKNLEEAIQKNPFNWLWSHRRWKHKKMAGMS